MNTIPSVCAECSYLVTAHHPSCLVERRRKKAEKATERALKKNTPLASYEADARSLAKILVRHWGDEAETVLSMTKDFLDEVRKVKR